MLWPLPNLITIVCEVRELDIMIYSWKQRALQMKTRSMFCSYPSTDIWSILAKACPVVTPDVGMSAHKSNVSRHIKIDIRINNFRCIF